LGYYIKTWNGSWISYVPSRFTDLFAETADYSHFASLDMTETDKSIEVKVDVPGVEEKDIDVTLS